MIAAKLGTNDDTTTAANYPVFYFAKNYKDTLTCLSATSYEAYWYLPSLAELFAVYKNITTIDAASKICGGDSFEKKVVTGRRPSALLQIVTPAISISTMGTVTTTARAKTLSMFVVSGLSTSGSGFNYSRKKRRESMFFP